MKLEVSAPIKLAQVVAELAFGGALVVWTRATSEGDADLGARTVVHLDGDVTTTITPRCLVHPGVDELFRRHDREMQRVGDLLRSGAARGTRMVALSTAILAAITTVANVASGHSWVHAIAAFGGVGGVGALAAWLVHRLTPRLVMRSAKRVIAHQRRARPPGS